MTGARLFALAALIFVSVAPAHAGEADVVDVAFTRSGDGYRFDVTVEHADEGWEHFANRWEVLGPDGEVIATRELAHPHVDEQPFTRSLSGVKIPDGVTSVTIRAHDSVDGYGGREMIVNLAAGDAATN